MVEKGQNTDNQEVIRDYAPELQKYLREKLGVNSQKKKLNSTTMNTLELPSGTIVHCRRSASTQPWWGLDKSVYDELIQFQKLFLILIVDTPDKCFVIPKSETIRILRDAPIGERPGRPGARRWQMHMYEEGILSIQGSQGAPKKESPISNYMSKWDLIPDVSIWIRDLIETFDKLGKTKFYHLNDIYKTFAEIRRSKNESLPKDYENIIRYYLQVNSRGSGRDLFQPKEIGSGYWMLKEMPASDSSSSVDEEILPCLQAFPSEADLEKIKKAHEALNLFLHRYPYDKHPDLIDSLQVTDIYERGSKESFYYYWSEVAEAVGKTGAEATVWGITQGNLNLFKDLLRIAVDKKESLRKKVDAPWEEINGLGGAKAIPKKIIYLYNSDKSLAVFSLKDMELFSTKLGKNYIEKARERYGKDYPLLSNGEKYELHTELLLEAKSEINSQFNRQWDNITFWRFLYHCIKSESSSDLMEHQRSETFEDESLTVPTREEMEKGYEKILDSLLIPKEKVIEIVTALASGRHVLLAGPIGTGKTRLAQLIPELFWEKIGGYHAEYYTATADWGTQDVIGGIYPKMENGRVAYDIQYGCVSETVARNWERGTDGGLRIPSIHLARRPPYRGTWLVIDEFNRADIDKAFGQLFTALRTRLLKIPTNETGTSYKELRIPQDYRIIGTLNTADKHFLFQLSDALKSRFAYIEIDIPRKEDYEKEVYYAMKNAISELRLRDYEDLILLDDTNKKVLPGRSGAEFYDRILQAYYFLDLVRVFKKLGTAVLQLIYQNMLVAVRITKDAKLSLDNALTSTLIPQLENLSSASLGTIEALYNENIVQYFKDAYKNPNRQSYGDSFEKVLEYLQIGNYKTRAEEFSAGVIKIESDNIWGQIQTAFEDKKKKFELGLVQFKQGITELRKSAVV